MIRPYLFWFRRNHTGSELCVFALTDAPWDTLSHLCPEGWQFNGFARICESEARQHLAVE